MHPNGTFREEKSRDMTEMTFCGDAHKRRESLRRNPNELLKSSNINRNKKNLCRRHQKDGKWLDVASRLIWQVAVCMAQMAYRYGLHDAFISMHSCRCSHVDAVMSMQSSHDCYMMHSCHDLSMTGTSLMHSSHDCCIAITHIAITHITMPQASSR